MLTPPTDRLHKFLTVIGLSIVFVSISYPISKYEQAELSRIDAEEKIEIAYYSYQRFSQKVKEETSAIYGLKKNGRLKEGVTLEQYKQALKDFQLHEPEVRKLEREMNDSMIQMNKQENIKKLYENQIKVWICAAVFGLILGLAVTYQGLKVWLNQPKSTR